jgi:hypothetical protein
LLILQLNKLQNVKIFRYKRKKFQLRDSDFTQNNLVANSWTQTLFAQRKPALFFSLGTTVFSARKLTKHPSQVWGGETPVCGRMRGLPEVEARGPQDGGAACLQGKAITALSFWFV